MPLIAFGHKRHVGKSSAAAYVTGKYDAFARLSFATRVKSVTGTLFPEADNYIYDHDYDVPMPEYGNKTARQLLQEVGDAARQIWPDVWIDAVRRKWEYLKQCAGATGRKPCAVIDDLRYRNEAEWVKRQGGMCVKIVRSFSTREKRLSIQRGDGAVDDHVSETDLDDYQQWDYVIVNDGDIEDLFLQVEDCLPTDVVRGA